DNDRLVEVNPYFKRVAEREGFYSEELMEELAERGSVRGMDQVPQWVQELFVTSHDISPEWHVKMQAAFQRRTDNAVSKTVNFPNSATVEDVRKVYMLAYREGCKGVTIYRDGSKRDQVLSTGQTRKTRGSEQPLEGSAPSPRKRPSTVRGVTEKVHTGHGNMYVTINFDGEGRPFELFSNLGKAGGCDSAQLEAISRLISLALRSGIEPEEVIDQLKGITCCPSWNGGGEMVRSGPDAVALALSRHIMPDEGSTPLEKETLVAQPSLFSTISGNGNGHGKEAYAGRCPECNNRLIYQESCVRCSNPECVYNRCG
ncbi:MAG: TSCPD domain-containing protein, partial [Dehalococcoidia bacterium]